MKQPRRRISCWPSTTESWKTSSEDSDPANPKQPPKRAPEEEEQYERFPKRPKPASSEVHAEMRDREIVPYPHLVDDSLSSIDTNLEYMDRHLVSLWDIVDMNEKKGTAKAQDGGSDDNMNSERDASRTPSPRPRVQPLGSPPSASRITTPKSLQVPSHTWPLTKDALQTLSPTSHSWPGTSPPLFLEFYRWRCESEDGRASKEGEEDEEGEEEREEGDADRKDEEELGHYQSLEDDQDEEWGGILSEERGEEEEENEEDDEEEKNNRATRKEKRKLKRKEKTSKVGRWARIAYWRRQRKSWKGLT